MSDFILTGGGTVYLLTPQTDAGRDWVATYLPEDALRLGEGVAVEHRYVDAILTGIVADGLDVEG